MAGSRPVTMEAPGTAASATTRPHFPCLEGLRALAASLVVLTHAGSLSGEARAGWFAQPAKLMDIGVAIFFVLSGFLIYRPFVDAHFRDEPPMTVAAFWWRRLLRIVPAYWLALAVLWGIWALHPGGYRMGFDLGSDWWKFFGFLQIYDARTIAGGIVQAWSVATEVTFYLLVPFWSLLIRRVLGRARRSPVAVEAIGVATLVAVGYLSRWWFSHSTHLFVQPNPHQPQGVPMRAVSFQWLPNQIDLFALGMGVAVLHAWASRTGRLDSLGRWLGAVPGLWWSAAVGVFLIDVYVVGPAPLALGYKSAHWQLRQLLYGTVALLLLFPLAFGDQAKGAVRRTLQWKPIWWVGVVSYGFYLWHLDWMIRVVNRPTLAGGAQGWRGWSGQPSGDANIWFLLAVGFAGGLGAAAISWYLVERPLLRLKPLVGGRRDRSGPSRPDLVDVAAAPSGTG